MTTVSRFSRQSDAGLRALNVVLKKLPKPNWRKNRKFSSAVRKILKALLLAKSDISPVILSHVTNIEAFEQLACAM